MKALVTCPPLLGMIGRYRPLFEQPGMEVAVPKLVHTKEVELLPMDSYLRQHARCAFGLHNALTTADASVGAYQCDCGLEVCGLSHYHIGALRLFSGYPLWRDFSACDSRRRRDRPSIDA
jgi:hypothetical protein